MIVEIKPDALQMERHVTLRLTAASWSHIILQEPEAIYLPSIVSHGYVSSIHGHIGAALTVSASALLTMEVIGRLVILVALCFPHLMVHCSNFVSVMSRHSLRMSNHGFHMVRELPKPLCIIMYVVHCFSDWCSISTTTLQSILRSCTGSWQSLNTF